VHGCIVQGVKHGKRASNLHANNNSDPIEIKYLSNLKERSGLEAPRNPKAGE
jgi:hypothetical protein